MALRAFIPAAGFGKRLRPLTDVLPKPLLPVLGHPIIGYVIDRLMELPIEKVGVNLHHLPEVLRDFLDHSPYSGLIEFFHEETILGTGGALSNAREFLSTGPFIVYNGDILCDADLDALWRCHNDHGNLVTLAVCNSEKINSVGLDGLGRLIRIGREGKAPRPERWVTFTGIAIYEPGFLKYLPAGSSHVTQAWMSAVADGKRVAAIDIGKARWSDLGTPETYGEYLFDELARRGQERFIGRDVYVPLDCELKGRVVLETGCEVGLGVKIEDAVALPGARIKSEERLKGKIASGDARIPVKIKRHENGVLANEIQMGGSNRYYQRVTLAEGLSSVKLKTLIGDPDFDRVVAYTDNFSAKGLPVPKILARDLRRREIFFQDLGENDLFKWFRTSPPQGDITKLYRRILDQLIEFQLHDVSDNPLLSTWIFDKATFVWESGYFLNRFVRAHLNIEPPDEAYLLDDLERLAEKADGFKKWVVHRDFQSQNVMLNGTQIFFIDYQGARMGPPAYDAVSLIYDPYCPLSDNQSDELKAHYIKTFAARAGENPEALESAFLYCGLQRHMQALGAYGYLSRIKGKKNFESYMPRGLALLKREVKLVKDEFPRLSALVSNLSL